MILLKKEKLCRDVTHEDPPSAVELLQLHETAALPRKQKEERRKECRRQRLTPIFMPAF